MAAFAQTRQYRAVREDPRQRRSSTVALAVLLLDACTVSQQVRRETPAEHEVQQALKQAELAFQKKDNAGLDDALRQARAAAGRDVLLLDRVADSEMAALIERDDLDAATARLSDRVAALSKAHWGEHMLHDRSIFVCEARGDQLCALLEADQMISVSERAPPPWPIRMRLGNLWQRAHTLRAFAETLQAENRAAAVRYASEAREEFNKLARESKQSLASIDILTEQFASMDGDCPTALAAAHALDLKALDPQDLFTTSVALDTCGDTEGAAAVRKQILASNALSLFDSVYRYLARTRQQRAQRHRRSSRVAARWRPCRLVGRRSGPVRTSSRSSPRSRVEAARAGAAAD